MPISENIEIEYTDEHKAFIEKFKPKKPTDECYTPEYVYNAVCDFLEEEYHVKRENFIRPFWPNADFKKFDYPENKIVVDNPPFSILASIIRFYSKRHIKFFLFAPTLTLFTAHECPDVCYIPVEYSLTYENGANVNSSFVTNIDPDYIVRTAPKLFKMLRSAEERFKKEKAKKLPKYKFPDNVITAAQVGRWTINGIDFKVKKENARYIPALDAQRKIKKSIFGGGYLLGKEAAAQAAQAAQSFTFELSKRELEIIKELSETT